MNTMTANVPLDSMCAQIAMAATHAIKTMSISSPLMTATLDLNDSFILSYLFIYILSVDFKKIVNKEYVEDY
jgi:hypothetical protein